MQVPPGREFLHASGALVCAAVTQEMLLDCMALVVKGFYVPGSYGTVTPRETVLSRLPSPGHCSDSRLKHIPILSGKEAYLLGLEL